MLREADASRINAVVNQEAVRPWVMLPGQDRLDLSAFVADPRNVVLMNEAGTVGVAFHRHEPGIYEAHTVALPGARGAMVLAAVRSMVAWMFTATDCMELLTRCPAHNRPAEALAKAVGGTLDFERASGWLTDEGPVAVRFYALRYPKWVRTADLLPVIGEWFHDRLEAENARLGIPDELHDDDAAHDRHVGAAVAMTELAGSIPATVAATALGGAALAAPGNMLLDAAQGSRLAGPLAAAGRFVTGQGGPGGSLASRVLSRGVAGAAGGAFGGAINTGLTGGDMTDNALTGAGVGLAAGAGLTGAGAAAGGLVNRLTGSVSPEVAALARRAQDLGIPIRAGQITDSPMVRFLDSTLSKTPGMGYGAANRAQQIALNRIVANAIGENADRITPAVMQAARTRLGQSFDRVAQGSFVTLDNPLSGDFTNIMREAQSVLTPAEVTPLQNLVRDGILAKFARLGDIGGEEYQALTRRGTPLDRLMQSNNPNVRHYAGQVREALDGALERSAPPELVQELRQTRAQWRAMKTFEDLAAKSPTGDISPAGMMQALQKGYGARVAYTGGGDLGDAARAGQRFLKEPPSSGTAERLDAKDRLGQLAKLGQLAGGAAGAAMGLNHFAPQIAAAAPGALGPAIGSAAAGFGASRLASQVLRSEALANRLIDRGLGTGQAGPVNRLLGAAAGAAPETSAPLYVRVRFGSSANDDAPPNRLDEFLRARTPQRAGMLP